MELKRMKVLIMIAIVLISASSSLADDNLAASLGLKGLYVTSWKNTWDDGLIEHEFEAKDSVLMAGPSVKIIYGQFFSGLTFLTSLQDFNVEEAGFKVGDGNRRDLDFVLGYAPFSWLSVICGYKQITAVSDQQSGSSASVDQGGPAIGISLNYLIPNIKISIYANAAYMYLDGQAWLQDTQADGFSYEGGMTYSPIQNLALSLGYKGQILDYDNDIAGKEELGGITFAIDYRF